MGSCSAVSSVAWRLVSWPVSQVVAPSKATAKPRMPKLAASFCPTLRVRLRRAGSGLWAAESVVTRLTSACTGAAEKVAPPGAPEVAGK
ncbi:hypothetical protein D3C71_1219520 [compost metagenome]